MLQLLFCSAMYAVDDPLEGVVTLLEGLFALAPLNPLLQMRVGGEADSIARFPPQSWASIDQSAHLEE